MPEQLERLERPRAVLAGSRFFCEGLVALLRSSPLDGAIVGTGRPVDAERLVRASSANVLVMELEATDHRELAAVAAVGRPPSTVRIVLVCNECPRERVLAGIRAGAAACVLMDGGVAEIRTALEAVCEGRRYMGPLVSDLLMQPKSMGVGGLTEEIEPVTPREAEVLDLIAKGMNGPQVAAKLGVSARTVHVHRSRIMRKLGVHNVAQLIRRAVELDLVKLALTVSVIVSP